nr:DNA polymerase Y family protein [Mangrovihabitans endophyticus]
MLWCPDWPVVAAEIAAGVPAAETVVVLHANRVLACSEAARAEGVRRGLRRREAQRLCPRLIVVEHDPGRDAAAFEPVVAAVEDLAVGVEIVRPGACAVVARGPARYFGGEEAAAERIVEQVAQNCAVESQVGIADGVFAAGLAARAGRIVPPGETPGFLAAIPVEALDRPDLTDLLRRLGVQTLGDFAALPDADVLTRFGPDGALAHRLAAGRDDRPLAVRKPPVDLDVSDTYDEPLDRVDVAAFAGRVLAERLHDGLAAHGLACTRLGIEAVTANGQELHRVWRHDGLLTPSAIADRVRWQLDGWLTGGRRGAPARPTAGLVRLRLVPDGVIVRLGLQPGLWGDAGAERDRAHRALSRVQGLLGPEAVVSPVLDGGRSADDQVRYVPWGDERSAAKASAERREAYPGPASVPVAAITTDPLRTVPPIPPPDGAPMPDPPPGAVRPAGEAAEPVPPATRLRIVAGRGSPVPVRRKRPALHPIAGGAEGPGGDGAPSGGAGPEGDGLPGAGSQRSRRSSRRAGTPPASPPWPGRLPRPAPAVVLDQPMAAVVTDAAGVLVGVSARLELSGIPARLVIDRAAPVEIAGWAGPWPVDERWWAPAEARRRARFQVALADGRAFLLSLADGHWRVEAVYD